jgi:hypothetical protein
VDRKIISGQNGVIKPEGEVRTSIRVLTTNCIINLVQMASEIFDLTLSPVLVEPDSEFDGQTMRDICIYSCHSDPLLRGSVYILIGVYIRSVFLDRKKILDGSILDLDSLIAKLKQVRSRSISFKWKMRITSSHVI